MNVIDRYLLSEWLKILGLILCAMMGLLVMQALYDDFRDLLNAGAAFGDILYYYATLMPSYLTVVLPISLLLSLLYVLGKFHRSNELTAIRAAGLNIFAATRILWAAALLLCGLTLWLNARIVPWSVEASRQLLEGFQYRAQAQRGVETSKLGMVTGVAFDNQRTGRMWYLNRYSRFTGRAYGVTVSELDRERRERTRIMAREAVYAEGKGWTFYDGREMWFDPEGGELMRTTAFAEKSIGHFREDPELMLLIDHSKLRTLSFFELQRVLTYFTLEDNPKVVSYAVRYYGMIADTLGPLIILAISIPFAVSGVRVNPVVGVSKSIGLFLVYYLLTNLATLLGGRGYVDPVWAALMPNLAMVGLATWFFGRMR